MSIVSGNWKKYLKFVILIAGLMAVMLMTPTSHASSPSQTFGGPYESATAIAGIEQKGNGPTVISANTKAIFDDDDIDGTIAGPGTVVKLSNGSFRIHASGIFDGTIDGRTGTAKFVSSAHGSDSSGLFAFCCWSGPLTLYDGTGGLAGLTATGFLSNDPVDGTQYTLDVIFR